MSNGTIKSWVKGVERRQRILNQTSLMRVEFKYENKAVPTASLAGTEASAMSRWHGAGLISRDHRQGRPARTTNITWTLHSPALPKTYLLAKSQDKIGDKTHHGQVPVKLIQLMDIMFRVFVDKIWWQRSEKYLILLVSLFRPGLTIK